MNLTDHQLQAATWEDRQALAETMIPLIGDLYRRRRVVTSLHGTSLINRSTIELLKAHRFARHLDESELSLAETLPILRVLTRLELGAASIDVAQLAFLFRTREGSESLEEFLREQLAEVVGGVPRVAGGQGPRDVVLYGFGRIGRLVARLLIERGGQSSTLRLRAVVVRRGSADDLRKRASLLRRDSVHGPFAGTITVDEENDTILANGTLLKFLYSDDPASIDYRAHGIEDAIVVDNTGRWRDEAGLARHLESPGARQVLLTAPGKGALKNIVHGINHDAISADDRIVSAASCTTNAITPILKAVHDLVGVRSGHVETVHSFTNDQNLIDNFHAGDRRGRSAALNMVITETGAATAVAKALPEMEGRLTGSSIRVPTPDVSLAILNLRTERPITRDAINAHLRRASLDSPLRRQIDYLESPEIVSTDILGSRHAGVVDGLATIATEDGVVLYVWYDNEFGYSCQVVRVLETLAGGQAPSFPAVAPRRDLAPVPA
ncbi:glyceraldehyde-3-phosphate dehydrogenase [Rathayibacter caricis]|uniref:glyceraldehyde-3-phosphate dehydrogenase n=1 Tax=Rathayibacter caricis TaxID=110936 RepID=UPI002467BD9B|nr:glyceraldehyde-3-phosphate dehydrogenase [Rathayibacter caricis]